MTNYRPRITDQTLEDLLECMGGILIQGPKWCGKTTSGRQYAKSEISLADPARAEMAVASLHAALRGPAPRLIDEWQEVPQLWDVARIAIDDRGVPGQFIFTGSAVPADRSQIRHSGTGRFAWLTMRSMSLFESGDSSGAISLGSLFDPERPADAFECDLDISRLAFLICRGGWPAALDAVSEKSSLEYAMQYVNGVVERDIIRADGVNRNPVTSRRLLRSLARHQGAQVSLNTIMADIADNGSGVVSPITLTSYLNALANIFVTEDCPAWNPNLRSRTAIRTSNTRYFTDPSIAAAALRVGPDDLLNDINTFGLLFETLAIRDLRVYAQANDGDVFHYRDKTGLECDAVIHLRNGKYGLVEIKLGGLNWISQGAASLNKLTSRINTDCMGVPAFRMVLTGVGPYAYKREDGVWVVPIGCLRN